MYEYNFAQWVLFFIIYCFIGWIYESLYVSFEHRKWVNRGFLHGPFLPIYGFGAIIILFCVLPVRKYIPLIFLFGMIGATVLEYFTGYFMEKLFHVRYWDYTYDFMNLNGYICLPCSLAWGVMSILLVKLIHSPIEKLVLGFKLNGVIVFDCLFMIYFIWDMVISAREAFDLRKIIDEQILQNEKVQRMQKRLDVLMAFAEDDKEEIQNKLNMKVEEVKAEREKLLQDISNAKNEFSEKISNYKTRAIRVLKRNPKATFGADRKKHIKAKRIRETLKEYFVK